MITHTKPSGIIKLTPSPEEKVYGVVMTFDGCKKIHFKTHISCLVSPDNEYFLFKVDREQVYVNNKVPEQLIDKLADDLGKYLYPIELAVDKQGYIRDIVNHAVLVRNWEKDKAKLERYYQGAVAEKICGQVDEDIRRKEKLLQAIKEDWFFAVYFSGIYGLKPYDFRDPTPIDLPMVPGAGMIRYSITREISRVAEPAGSVLIDCKGGVGAAKQVKDRATIAGSSSVSDGFRRNAGQQSGTLRLRYRLYRKDFSVRSIICESQLTGADGVPRQVQVEIYHQVKE